MLVEQVALQRRRAAEAQLRRQLLEIITVQALPDPLRRQDSENIAGLVAAECTLLVLAAAHDPTCRSTRFQTRSTHSRPTA